MKIAQPIHEHEAPEDISAIYSRIKKTFDIPYVPMVFKYLANYQPFFGYMWESLEANVKDPTFQTLSQNIEREIIQSGKALFETASSAHIVHTLLPDKVIRQRLAEEVRPLFSLQCQLAYLCIAIRESTKGWAVGAKYLETEQAFHTMNDDRSPGLNEEIREMVLAESTSALSVQSDLQHPLMTFLVLLHEEFGAMSRKDEYVFARVQVEKSLDSRVQNMPQPIRASFNEVAQLVRDTDELPYIFYLLSEKFPVVHAVASLMWGVGIGMLE